MKSPAELWGVGLAAFVVLTIGLLGAGINLGGALHGFVSAMIHVFGTSL
ncbi:MAG TPA: hypothetical protein VMH90_04125 [Thermoplasmata archaeon]|nr:hypothetical protein [Thermoplasmata archaeon]